MITREDKGKVVVLWEVAARPKASNRFLSKRTPPLCHLDRSAPGFPASLPWTRPRVCRSLRKGAYCSPAQPTSSGNPGERSGEVSVWMPLLRNVFRRSEADLSRLVVEGSAVPRTYPEAWSHVTYA